MSFAMPSFPTGVPSDNYHEIPTYPRLAPREKETLALVLQGLPSKTIAEQMFISKRTVDFHLHSIFRKLGVKNRVQALVRAEYLGLLK